MVLVGSSLLVPFEGCPLGAFRILDLTRDYCPVRTRGAPKGKPGKTLSEQDQDC